MALTTHKLQIACHPCIEITRAYYNVLTWYNEHLWKYLFLFMQLPWTASGVGSIGSLSTINESVFYGIALTLHHFSVACRHCILDSSNALLGQRFSIGLRSVDFTGQFNVHYDVLGLLFGDQLGTMSWLIVIMKIELILELQLLRWYHHALLLLVALTVPRRCAGLLLHRQSCNPHTIIFRRWFTVTFRYSHLNSPWGNPLTHANEHKVLLSKPSLPLVTPLR